MPLKRRKPVLGAGAGKVKRPGLPVKRPGQALPEMRGMRAVQPREPMPRMRMKSGLQQRASVQRRNWGFFNFIRDIFFPRERLRAQERRHVGSGVSNLVSVRMDMARQGIRPRYIGPGKRQKQAVTAVKGHQLARRGKVAGVLKKSA